MAEVGLGVVLALVAIAVVVGAIAAATWFGWFARSESARADGAEVEARDAEAQAGYERRKAKIEEEADARVAEVDRRGADRARVERLLRGGAPPDAQA